jgi:hypothetical protein
MLRGASNAGVLLDGARRMKMRSRFVARTDALDDRAARREVVAEEIVVMRRDRQDGEDRRKNQNPGAVACLHLWCDSMRI